MKKREIIEKLVLDFYLAIDADCATYMINKDKLENLIDRSWYAEYIKEYIYYIYFIRDVDIKEIIGHLTNNKYGFCPLNREW